MGRVANYFRWITGLDESRPAYLSVGICRIALFLAVFWVQNIVVAAMNDGDFAKYLDTYKDARFYPFGLLKLFGSRPPAAPFWDIVLIAARVSTVMAIVGLATRPAMIVSVTSSLLMVLLETGWFSGWSHPYNVVFLTGIAFMFGNGGASLSLDRWITNRVFWWPFSRSDRLVLWPVLLGQMSVAGFFFAAGYSKLYHSGLPWIFSDNMRNSLAVTWYGPREFSVPTYIEWIWSYPAVWIFIAAGHFATQLFPIAAIFSIDRPKLRLFEGFIFVISAIGLRVMMTVWNPWWLLLAAFFVDWDYFFGRRKAATTSTFDLRYRAAATFSAIFLGYYGFVVLLQRGSKELNYPFCSMDMYSGVYVEKPYNEHRNYDWVRGAVTIDVPHCPAGPRWANITGKDSDQLSTILPRISRRQTPNEPIYFRCENGKVTFATLKDELYITTYIDRSQHEIAGMLSAIRSYLPELPQGSRINLMNTVVRYPAYPNSPKPFVAHEASRGMTMPDGSFRSLQATARLIDDTVLLSLEASGYNNPEIQVEQISGLDFNNPRKLITSVGEGSLSIPRSEWRQGAYTTLKVKEQGETETVSYWGPGRAQ